MHLSARAAMAAIALFASGAPQPQASQQQAAGKIVYVQTDVLMQNAPGKDSAQALYNKKQDSVQKVLKALGDSLNKLVDKYKAEEAKLTPAQKDAREKAINDLQLDAQAKQIDAQAKLQQIESNLMQPLQDAVKATLDDMRKTEGYAMILDAAAVLSSDKNLNITDEAVLKLRAKANTTLKRGGGGSTTSVNRSGGGRQ
jgi:outer membrane protein